MNEDIAKLRELLKSAECLKRGLESCIEALEDMCDHKWYSEGQAGHYDWYTCTKCGKTKYER